jgi:prepilin peptidase CpaA
VFLDLTVTGIRPKFLLDAPAGENQSRVHGVMVRSNFREAKECVMTQVPPEVVWLVSVVLVEAAIIDGLQLRVPNWLTFHFVAGGMAYACWAGGTQALLWSMAGASVGLLTLLPLYAIGGMGAGDVKLMAGLGAWMGPALTLGAFVASAITGGVFGLAMIVASGDWIRHWAMFQTIGHEIISIRDPAQLAQRAGERKKSMMLLPYGIPIAVGSILYFGWMRLFLSA